MKGATDNTSTPYPDREPAAGLVTIRPVADRLEAIAELRREVSLVLGRPATAVPCDRAVQGLGLDSLGACELAGRIEERWGCRLAPWMLGDRSVEELAAEIAAPGAAGAVGEPVSAATHPEEEPEGGAAEPLSEGERALWYLWQLAPASAAYHLAAAATLEGEVFDRGALRRAFQALADRHPALCSTLELAPGEQVVRRARPGGEVVFEVWQAAGWSAADLARRLAEEAARPFDLEHGPPLRIGLADRGSASPVLLVTLHHVAADLWSLAVMAQELVKLYAACTAGLPAAAMLGPPPPTPGALARREQRLLAGGEGERLWEYWRRQLADAPQRLSLPADRPRPALPAWRGGRERSALSPQLTADLGALGSRAAATPFATLLTGWLILLHRLAGQDDLLVGVPTAGRDAPELARAVGYHVNPLVVRSTMRSGAAFAPLLAALRGTLQAAFGHQAYPFPLLAKRLQSAPDPGRHPLFQVMAVQHRAPAFAPAGLAELALGEPGARLALGALTLESVPLPERAAQLDLALFVAILGGRLTLHLQYDADLFDAVTVRRLLSHLAVLLAAAVAEPGRPAESLPLLAAGERHQLVREWNDQPGEPRQATGGAAADQPGEPRLATGGAAADTGFAAAGQLSLHDLVAAQAAQTPEATALACAGDRLSYRALTASAGRLAAHLRSLGAGPEVRVAVLAERSPEMVIGLLAILAAGACYVPLDPAYPAARLALMAGDARPRILLTQSRLRGRLPLPAGVPVLDLDGRFWDSAAAPAGRPGVPALAGNLAYLVYTSGSTGSPKAVAVEHRAAVALCAWARSAFAPAELSGVLAATSICFDLSVFEIFAPLACGGAVILVQDVLALTRPAALPAAPPVSLISTVPSAMAELLPAGAIPASVATIALAGEVLHGALLAALHAGHGAIRVLNLYGPSEDTTYSTCAEPARGEERPSIGRPLANGRAFVVDSRLELVPIGVAGELLLGGAGLARGYFGRPEVTAARFVPDGLSGEPAARLYRTGDLARLLPDGRLQFLGRRDHQVKVRGFRLELGEVDAALAACPGVGEAATVLRDDGGGPRLVAYVAPSAGAADAGLSAPALAALLRERLPAPAVPAEIVILAALPHAAGGKIDRAALPAPVPAGAPPELPRNPVEDVLAALWCEALGRDRIGVHDDLFALGAHSLLAVRVAARIRRALGQDVPLPAILAARTVAGLAARLSAGSDAGPRLAPVPRRPLMPTSAAQRRLWFLDRLAPGGAVYNLPLAVRLEGPLDTARLAGALDRLACRHESLRTSLVEAGGRPWQRIAPPAPRPPRLPLADLSRLPPAARLEEARAQLRAAAHQPFDLAAGPLLRRTLLRLAGAEHLLVLVLHHAIADAASLDLLLDELAAHYRAAAAGVAPQPAPALQYADYAAWEQQAIEQGAFAPQLAHWAARLAGVPASLGLPVDRPRPARHSGRGSCRRSELPAAAWSSLRRYAHGAGATPFMAVLAAWVALLHRISGAADVVVGAPIANRDRVELEPLIGMFVNTLALRCAPHGGQPGSELLASVRDDCLAAYAHREVPFDLVVEQLRPERLGGRNPLFDVLLAFGPAPRPRWAGDLELAPAAVPTATAKLDLTLFASEQESGLDLVLESDRDLFDAATAARWLGYLRILLGGMAAAPATPLADFALLGPGERHQVLVEANADAGLPSAPAAPGTAAGAQAEGCLHELVEAQARRSPEAVAVRSATAALTYAELWDRVEQLAAHLAELGVEPEMPVGIYLDRSPAMVTALLATLLAGGAYLPLDPAYPEARLRFMLADAGARLVLTRTELAGRLGTLPAAVVAVDRFPGPRRGRRRRRPHADNLAYLIYTSGSTGPPKGVAIRHRSAVARVRWARECFSAAECAALLAATSICFDLSVFELFVPLSLGGSVVLLTGALELAGAPAPVSLINTVPSVLAELLRSGTLPPSVCTVNLAGEALPPALVARLGAEPGVRRILNLYGPSEDTIYSTWAEVTGAGAVVAPPIGRPLPGTAAHALDSRLRPAPLGVAAELYLGGVGLARGYHRRPDLTAERFLPSPCGAEPGLRLYRTGDLVRRRPDGNLDFLGRVDEQVKIRGLRVEPGEIEAALREHRGVRQAAVGMHEDAGATRQLVAYVVPAGEPPPAASELRAFLAERLPQAIVPGRFVIVAALPATASGKLDRRALPALAAAAAAAGRDPGRRPEGPIEEVLAAIWAEVLSCPRVGADEDFFALGGHSLLAAQVLARARDVLGVTLPLRSLFEAPTVAALAARVAALRGAAPHAAGRPQPAAAPAGEDGSAAPLSPAQQRLWFLHRLEPRSPAYHIAGAVRLDGPLRPDLLAAALAAVVRRQTMLRTVFRPTPSGQPVQVAMAGLAVPLPRLDLRALPGARRAGEARRLAVAAARQPFDLERGPPVRLALVRLAAGEHLLAATLHHIAADGWSLQVLLNDLARAYAHRRGGGPDLPPRLPISYADHARWERQRLDGEATRSALAYWRRQLAGGPAVLSLPGDRPRPAVRSGRGRRHAFTLPGGVREAMAAAGRRQGASPFMVLLAAFLCLLRRIAREEDLLVGTPVANRERVELEEVVGCFADTLVLRTRVEGPSSFAEMVARGREVTLAAFDHRELPFERLVEELQPARDLSHTPIFQVLLVMQNAPVRAIPLPGLATTREEVDTATAKFDLTLAVEERGGALAAALEYASDIFDAPSIVRLAGHFTALLAGALAAPGRRCDELCVLGEAERHQLLLAWNDTRRAEPPHLLHQLCSLQAARTPDAIAVAAAGESVSFGELDRSSNRLANHLLARGAGRGAVVGICAERSPELVTGLLGILKAGAAYLPLDPEAPRERLTAMAGEAGVPLLLTQERLAAGLPPGLPVLCLEREGAAVARRSAAAPGVAVDREALAYVIYTSGSSGKPKGVMNTHRAVVNRLLWMQSVNGLAADDSVLHKTSTSFDVSVWELFWPLVSGARLVLAAAHGHRDPAYQLELIGRERITVAHFVPAMLQAFLDQPNLAAAATLRLIVASGEALPPAVAARCGERLSARLENLYGPTEAAIEVTAWRCGRGAAGNSVPIGRPIANARVLLLDGGEEPAPIGVPAELHIGGVPLARGYLGRPELTAERFVPDPFAGEPGARLYRTGDLARLLPGGELDFLGRLDHQVKIRGVRIEPGEIEAALLARPDLREAVVTVCEQAGERRLAAYVVPAAAPGPDAAELGAFLRERLPATMVPACFVSLERLPLLRTGKVDRRALPAPGRPVPAAGYVAPRNAVEVRLAALWAEVLRCDRAGLEDNFFTLGGHSLLAIQLVSRIADAFHLDLEVREVFAAPTVGTLAEVVTRRLVEAADTATVDELLARAEAAGDGMSGAG